MSAQSIAGLLRTGLGRERAALLRRIGRLARSRDEQAYLVGGVVRDLLLVRESRDLDVVVVGDGPGLAEALAVEAGGCARRHRAFGTASLITDKELQVDLVTARRESYRRPGALPDVEPAGLLEDLRRRDFSVNCLAVALQPGRFGRLVDPLGGSEDLNRRVIRVLHDGSFVDDPTRIFRALRFSSRLGFDIEPGTGRLIDLARRRGAIATLSAARLRREVAALLDEAGPARGVGLIQARRLWPAIEPRVRVGPPERVRLRRLEHVLRLTDSAGLEAPAPAWVAALALLLLERRAGVRTRLIERLRPDRRSARMLADAPAEARRLLRSVRRMKAPRPGAVDAACRRGSALSVALAAVVLARGRRRELLENHLLEWRALRPRIRGTDLIRAGIPQGPRVARGLAAVLRARVEGRAHDRATELNVALRAARRA